MTDENTKEEEKVIGEFEQRKENWIKLYQKLHAVMSEVGTIKKDARNDFHKYEYASEHAIKAAIQPLLIKNKLIFGVTIDKLHKDNALTTIYCTYYFTDVESGCHIKGRFIGTGSDTGDKGVYKALTGAIKYILTSQFLIPTGDDPEVETKTPPAPASAVRPVSTATAPPVAATPHPAPANPNLASDAQKKYIFKLAQLQGIDAEEFKEQVKRDYSLESFTLLTKAQASEVIESFGKP